MKSFITLFACFLLAVNVSAQPDLQSRRDTILNFFTTHDIGSNYPAATARILDTTQRESGLAMLRELTSSVSPDIIDRFRMTASYLYVQHLVDEDQRARFAYIWEHFPTRPLQGEHEEVAYYTALYLTTRVVSDEARFFNGKNLLENQLDARAFLLHWIKESTEVGQREFDSPTYGTIFLTAMLLLRDFSGEVDLSRRADLMAQWLLADFAHDHLNGNYCGAHAREHMLGAMQPISTDMSSISWLYFGDGPQTYSREQLWAALSDFVPHPAIIELATVRREAFVSWERKRPAKRIRGGIDSGGGDVVRYTYMDPLYAIGSIPGGLIQPREQHSWDVTWISRDPDSPATLFVMQPWSDPAALLPFLPHEGELSMRTVGMLDSYFDTVTKTVGGSPFEDVFQHRNTLIALYDIGKVTHFPVIAGFFPPVVDTMQIDSLHSKWITIKSGDVYIAVRPLKPYRLVDGMFGKRFFSAEKRNGLIVQVAGRNEIGSFNDFVKRVHATPVDLKAFDSDVRVRYTNIFGDKMDFMFRGKRTVNEREALMPAESLFSSSWCSSVKGSGVLTVHASRGDLTIDMQKLELRSGE
jgi:hypothetical protein